MSHPARQLSEQERLDYLAVVAYMAWADRVTERAELVWLAEMCTMFGVTGEGVRKVVAAASAPDLRQVRRALTRFRQDPIRVTLLADVMVLTYVNGRVMTSEAMALSWIARELNLSLQHIFRVGHYIEGIIEGQTDERLTRMLATKLEGLPGDVPPHEDVSDLLARLRRSEPGDPG